MATKEEALQYVRTLSEQQVLTKEELEAAFDSGVSVKTDVALHTQIGIAEILYYIGGGVIFLGVSILLSQNWSTLSFATKILATLGAGIAAYSVGVLLGRDEKTESASPAFYFITALVSPIGLYVLFDNAGFDALGAGVQTLISGIMLAVFLLSFAVFRKSVFVFFSILFSTWLFYALTDFLVSSNPIFDWHFYAYRTLASGIVYMLLGYSFSKNKYAPLADFLYGFGILGFLGAALALSEWQPHQNVFWELLYPIFVFGALYLSVYLKSKSFLTWGTIFLMLYILKITSEYFTSGLGWPLSLVMAGLAMIAVGYMSLSLNRKYLSVRS